MDSFTLGAIIFVIFAILITLIIVCVREHFTGSISKYEGFKNDVTIKNEYDHAQI